jgi:two-component system cell cycle response regulator
LASLKAKCGEKSFSPLRDLLVFVFYLLHKVTAMPRRKRVLVVDDNPMNREIIEEMLADEYEILMTDNGSDALRLAARHRPSVALLDVMLPGLDGYDICRKLRVTPGLADLRIVMVTAKAMPSERAHGFDSGADAYVTKPFDDGDLLAAIRSPAHFVTPSTI